MKRKVLKRTGYLFLVLLVLMNIMAAFHAYNFTKFYETSEERKRFNPANAGILDKTKALLFGVKSYKKPIDVLPNFPYNTIALETEDGFSLEAWESSHDGDTVSPLGTVIMFHGHGGNKAGVLKEAETFYKMNYQVLLVDFRAHGNSSGSVCTIGYHESTDVKAAFEYIKAQKKQNIILWGISLGAAAVMKSIYDFDLKPSAVILEMPFSSLLEAVKARCRLLGVPQQPTASLLTFWGGLERGFNGFDHEPKDYAKKISCPVLLQWGSKDNRVTREETKTIYSNLSSTNKFFAEYNMSGHQSLCTNEPEKWVKEISALLKIIS